ncbi:MAG: hypothetical protein Q8P35_03215 [Candidatus Yanofskybacteria bacterium]|nr:hypothetical protein [Candidatus Yanofskybacteria bacterium]
MSYWHSISGGGMSDIASAMGDSSAVEPFIRVNGSRVYALLEAEGYREDQTLTCNARAALVYRGQTIVRPAGILMVDTCIAYCAVHELLLRGVSAISGHYGCLPHHLHHLQDS